MSWKLGEFHIRHVDLKVKVNSPTKLFDKPGIEREVKDEQTDLKISYIKVICVLQAIE